MAKTKDREGGLFCLPCPCRHHTGGAGSLARRESVLVTVTIFRTLAAGNVINGNPSWSWNTSRSSSVATRAALTRVCGPSRRLTTNSITRPGRRAWTRLFRRGSTSTATAWSRAARGLPTPWRRRRRASPRAAHPMRGQRGTPLPRPFAHARPPR